MITKKGVEEYLEKCGTISDAKSIFDDAVYLLDYLIKELEENEPQAKYEISTLRGARDLLEQYEGDLESDD